MMHLLATTWGKCITTEATEYFLSITEASLQEKKISLNMHKMCLF